MFMDWHVCWRCFHQKFGMGVVNEIDGDHLTIDFDKAGTKKVVAAFVEKPWCSDHAPALLENWIAGAASCGETTGCGNRAFWSNAELFWNWGAREVEEAVISWNYVSQVRVFLQFQFLFWLSVASLSSLYCILHLLYLWHVIVCLVCWVVSDCLFLLLLSEETSFS